MDKLSAIIDKEIRKRNITKLRWLGYTFKEIGLMYEASDTTVYYWLRGNRRAGKRRDATLYFRPKPKDGKCEICGNSPPQKKPDLSHHCWDPKEPSVGIWMCWKCLGMMHILDSNPGLAKRYFDLKRAIIRNYAKRMEESEFIYA